MIPVAASTSTAAGNSLSATGLELVTETNSNGEADNNLKEVSVA
jgi:hypothetical protein